MSDEEYTDVEYTDEDLLVATQIAYFNFSGKTIRKINKTNPPTLSQMLNDLR